MYKHLGERPQICRVLPRPGKITIGGVHKPHSSQAKCTVPFGWTAIDTMKQSKIQRICDINERVQR